KLCGGISISCRPLGRNEFDRGTLGFIYQKHGKSFGITCQHVLENTGVVIHPGSQEFCKIKKKSLWESHQIQTQCDDWTIGRMEEDVVRRLCRSVNLPHQTAEIEVGVDVAAFE